MKKPAIRVLILEDSPEEAELTVYELRRCGFEPEWQRVETKQDYEEASIFFCIVEVKRFSRLQDPIGQTQ